MAVSRPSLDPQSRRWRGARSLPLALAGALASVALGVLLAAPGCLNPRPDEDPSVDSTEGIEPGEQQPSTPVRESCDDNPYLTGCEDNVAVPDNDSAEEGTPANGGAAPGAPEGPPDVGVADAGAADAGPPTDETDAQAP